MRVLGLLLALVATPGVAQRLIPGIYTNEEEVYFASEAGTFAAPWTAIMVDADGVPHAADMFGTVRNAQHTVAMTGLTQLNAQTLVLQLQLPSGATTTLRRARPVTCWGTVPRFAKKADGSDDWYFASGLKLHDQGGRVTFGGGDSGAPPVILRMRNVVWPSGPNKPSLVLYVHKPDSPDRAESYSWADPAAKRIGINLRWMQASCTID